MRRRGAQAGRDSGRSVEHCLVLTRIPWGESSLIAHVFSRGRGRVQLLARGAYRPTSRYFAVLDLFDTLELELGARPGDGLTLLHAGSIARRRRGPTRDLQAYRAALSVLELLDLASRPGQPEPELFERAEAALDELDRLGRGEPNAAPADSVALGFRLAFLGALGLAPALATCATCGSDAPTPGSGPRRTSFSGAAGGRLCVPCARAAEHQGLAVTVAETLLVEVAGACLAAGGAAAPLAALDPARRRALGRLVQGFLEHHLEQRPRLSEGAEHPAAPSGRNQARR